MKIYFTLLLLVVSSAIFSQTYNSAISEHWYSESVSKPVTEKLNRSITIADRMITITSYGKVATDTQKWVIQDKLIANADSGVIEVFSCYLASGEPSEYPA